MYKYTLTKDYSLVQDLAFKLLNSRVTAFVEKSLVTLKVMNYSSRRSCQNGMVKLFAGNLVVAKCLFFFFFQARNTNSQNCFQYTSARGRSEVLKLDFCVQLVGSNAYSGAFKWVEFDLFSSK